MLRRQVYFRQDTYYRLKVMARQERKPTAALIREIVEEGLDRRAPSLTTGEALLRLAELGKKLGIRGEPNLSRDIDTILYDEV